MDLMTIVISVGVFVISALLTIISFFLKGLIKRFDTLEDLFSKFQIVFAGKEATDNAYWEQCERVHGICDKRLDNHGTRLDQHEIKISILEERAK
jgi:hypothetical protein